MNRFVLVFIILIIVMAPVFAEELDDTLARVDELYIQGEHIGARDLLEELQPERLDADQAAQVYWRLARTQLEVGNLRENAGASDETLLEIFEQGEAYADKAIAAKPDTVDGLFWKSGNIGRWGQTKGVIDSLFKAGDMRDVLAEALELNPEHADSYYVLSQLYIAVPGFISFGNDDYGVSLARKSVALMEAELASNDREYPAYGFYVALAEALIERDWSERKRNRNLSGKQDDYRESDDALERGWYFEGTISIPAMSDEQEAREILQDVIQQINRRPDPRPAELSDLESAEDALDSI